MNKVEFVRVDGQAVPIYFVAQSEVTEEELLAAYWEFASREVGEINKPS